MKKQVIKLSVVGLILLLSANIYASNEKEILEIKDRPVDDAVKTVVKEDTIQYKYKLKEDTIKGGDKLKDHYYDIKISLKSIKGSYKINRKDLLFPPYRCFIYHNGGKETEIGIIDKSSIYFEIKKSLLNVGDIILVTNKLDINSKNNPIKKMIIEEIEIKK